MNALYTGLLANFGILAMCGLLVSSVTPFWTLGRTGRLYSHLASGLVFGATTAALILFSTTFVSGTVFDVRAAPAILSGIIGGPWAALITAVIGGGARLFVGGDWVVGGVGSVLFYCSAGLALSLLYQRRFRKSLSLIHLAPLAALITFLSVPIFFINKPFEVSMRVVEAIFPTLLLSNIISVTALGFALLMSVRSAADRQELLIMQAAVKRAANGVTITDASDERKIVFANDAVEKITGYRPAELIGRSTDVFFGADAPSDELKAFRRTALVEQEASATFINFRKDGAPFHSQVTIAPVFSSRGQVTHFVGVFSDVTKEMKTRSALKTVCGQIPMALIYTNPQRDVEFINDAGAALFDADMDELGGANIQTIIGDDLTTIFLPWIEAALAGDEVRREQRLSIRGGDEIDARLTFAPTVSDEGDRMGVIISIEDITAYKQMEEALAQSQRLQSIGTLTGGIAHDFNNLNTVVIGNLDLLKLAANDDEKAEYIDEAMAAAQRGARLTQSLLSFGRQAMLQPDRIDLRGRLTELENLLRASIRESTRIEFINSTGPLETNVDQTSLESAILNLVLNADQAIGGQGGHIRVEFREKVCTAPMKDNAFAGDFGIEPLGRFAAITVSDNGPGVPHDIRDKIIEPFFTTKGRHSGTGLGLAMVHGFVRQSGGFMRISDNAPSGAAVSLYLPLSEGSQIVATSAHIGSPDTLADRRIA